LVGLRQRQAQGQTGHALATRKALDAGAELLGDAGRSEQTEADGRGDELLGRHVLLDPQREIARQQFRRHEAFRVVIPPLTSEFMNVFKNSSVAFAIGVMELTFQARQMQEDSEQGIETYLAVTVLYFICAFTANRVMALIERRTRVPGYIAGR
jgi:hypothetical protein